MLWILLIGAGLLIFLVMMNIMIMTVVYHRYLTHRGVDLNRWLARGLTVILQGLSFAPPRTWVSSHMYHHGHTDEPEDPYSPKVHGFWKVLLLTPWLVTRWRQRTDKQVRDKLCQGMPDPGFYKVCDHWLFCVAITTLFATGFFLLFGWLGLLLYGLQFVGVYLVTGWINSVGHTHGERPHDNSAVNRRGWLPYVLNLYMCGEWLHNHHHHRPGSANFGLMGEFDLGYFFCRILAFLRLAKIRSAVRLQPAMG